MATDKYTEKYGQLSGADMEILGAREQAATARALRTAYKPTQGQMVGGWYVKPTWSQNLADAMMQYNNYKNEQAGTTEAKRLIDARQALSDEADAYVKTRDVPVRPGYQVSIPAIESDKMNQGLDEYLGAGLGTDEQGKPLFSDASATPSATPSAMPNDGAQAYIPPTATATGNVNANPTNNQYMGDPLANAVRNAPLEGAVAGANNQSALPPVVGGQNIPAGGQASADGTMPAVTVTPEPAPEPSMIAKILRGEGEYAPVQKAIVQWQGGKPITGDEYLQWAAKAEGLGGRHLAQDIMKRAEIQGHTENAKMAADTARATAQMADLKVQREGILNRQQSRELATERIADNATREKQRAEDKKEAAESLRVFTAQEHALNRTLTREESSNRRADRQATRDQAQLGRLGKDERYVQDDKGQPTGKTELIPGTTTWMKAKSDSSGEFQSLTAVNRGADKLRKDIKAILSDSGFEKSFGQIAGRTPDSAADVQRVANLFRNIEGQLQARGLGINKQENGSIGAMAVAEWEKMAALLAVVKRTDSPEAARAAYLGALDILDGVTSAASQKYQNEWGGGQFDLSSKKSGSAPSGGVKKYNPDTGKIE